MRGVAAAIDMTVVASVLGGLPLTVHAVLRRARPDGAASASRRAKVASPGLWLLVVTAAIYLNQVLVNVYVIRVHGGDVSFVARYLPSGWFELADHNGVIRWLAAVFPAPELLAVTVLRVPALLELPFVVLAYLTVCRWWDRRLYRCLASPAVLALACVAYTVTFCLIEWSLPNPYTGQDLGCRVVAGVLTAAAVSWMAHTTADGDTARPGAAGELVVSAVSAGAVGYLVLVVYDTALLYNLGRLDDRLPGAIAALVILVAARFTATRPAASDPRGIGIDTLATGLGWFVAVFFVPALAIRYALEFGTAAVAIAAGAVVVVTAAVLTARDVISRLPRPRAKAMVVWLIQSGIVVLAGIVAASAVRLIPAGLGYPEAKLLVAAVLFLATTITGYAVTDQLAGQPRAETRPPPIPWSR